MSTVKKRMDDVLHWTYVCKTHTAFYYVFFLPAYRIMFGLKSWFDHQLCKINFYKRKNGTIFNT